MMNLRKHLHSAILGWGIAAGLTVLVSAAGAQQGGAINPQNPDLTRQELASFDQFLDQHPDIDRQLRANPSLINNADFVNDHPELGKFLADHTQISEEIKENPSNFMHREQRFDRAENRMRNANPDVTRGEVAAFDQFLDKHPDIDKQLTANPSLINNADFLKNNPDLGKFLADHKQISEEIKENPSNFMHREQRFDRAEDRMHNTNPDVTRKEIASFDHFLDKHPDIDKQLEANPGLVNDQKFLDHHHDLRAFLKDHPEIREELHENASGFMRREQGFDAAENSRSRSQFDAKNPDLTKKQLAAFDDFLDHHKGIAKDLRKDPNLVNDAKFVKDHNDLKTFLAKNPGVSDELRENPTDFMRQESRFERNDHDRHHDKQARADKDKDKDKHKMTAMEEKEKLQTANPH